MARECRLISSDGHLEVPLECWTPRTFRTSSVNGRTADRPSRKSMPIATRVVCVARFVQSGQSRKNIWSPGISTRCMPNNARAAGSV